MPTISVTREIAAPPERVWAVVTDIDRAAEVMKGIDTVERVGGGTGFEVGTTWRETRTMLGRQSTETMTVTAIEPGRSYTVEADSHGTHFTSVITVTAQGDGTLLAMTFGGEAQGLAAKLAGALGKLFEGATRKLVRRDLDDIAAAAEA
ncbi:SRPBCC family protein [Nocardia otitidiscaviarum]|uniref:SRPBCC family protein n=1 Tax=Nocardia otitidiscaviarum TaxID=1823 RepID=A0A516NT18_9NOCA|nr:SRPBCC family protein [Nocardia otitidiscaviarum]MCP9621340.1 SRPBCC family protein [Nocardia otitidiscaviarum]QDP82056.1 SRPBCC family protein [Nocardia otitidiscaviarum]